MIFKTWLKAVRLGLSAGDFYMLMISNRRRQKINALWQMKKGGAE